MASLTIPDFAKLIYEIIFVQKNLGRLFDLKYIKDEGFGRFWSAFAGGYSPGRKAAMDMTDTTMLYLADRGAPPPDNAPGSFQLIPPLLTQASGLVLDVGPGTGSQLPFFGRNPHITKMIGIEPVMKLHADIARRVAKLNLPYEYKTLACGAEEASLVPALAKEGLLGDNKHGEVFDSIVCIRVLCSVDNPSETTMGLYQMLKPGGKLIVVEHIRSPWEKGNGSVIARAFQAFYMLIGWSIFFGNCSLVRDTEDALRGAANKDGGWAKIELKTSLTSSSMPYVSGILTKKG